MAGTGFPTEITPTVLEASARRGVRGRAGQHLRVWPHSWVVMQPKNTDKADDTCGRRGDCQDKALQLDGPCPCLLPWGTFGDDPAIRKHNVLGAATGGN